MTQIQELLTHITDNLTKYSQSRQLLDSKLKALEDILLKRDLQALNSTLLPELQLHQPVPAPVQRKPFPNLYLQTNPKTYVKQVTLPVPELEAAKYPPFVSQRQNCWDVHANTKGNAELTNIIITETSANFANLLNSTKQQAFLGETKATFPTIVYEGKQEHPMLSCFSNPAATGQSRFAPSVQELGGIKDALKKSGFDSTLMNQRRKLYEQSFKKYANFVERPLLKSNTRNIVAEPIKPEPVIQIKNPFLPKHLQ